MPKFIYSPRYVVDIGDHVFPTRKFGLAAEVLRGHGEFLEPRPPSREDLLLAHDEIWINKVMNCAMSLRDQELMELPFSQDISRAHQLAEAVTGKGYELMGRHNSRNGSGIVSFRKPGIDSRKIVSDLRANGVITAPRQGWVRASPHFYISPDDIARTADMLP